MGDEMRSSYAFVLILEPVTCPLVLIVAAVI